ncbi:hypothetical protein BJ944DRAFT_290549 [Cunninghamella echinulata]|nr:hypothetical protein BJ944DRAFT_290549 [Cunninghamella echinulata]
MLILKYNQLPANDLFIIERHLVRWIDDKGPKITPEWHVLDHCRTDLYGHLLGLFGKLNSFELLSITPSQLLDFFMDVDIAYLHTPYHSFYHAVDILFMLYYMLMDLNAVRFLKPMDLPILFIAALCHDVGHPGYNNMYQVNSNTTLAKKYDNTSVLENYSIDITLQLLSKHKIFNSSSAIENEQQQGQEWKEFMKQLIISTDMIYHFELQEKANQLKEIIPHHDWSYDPSFLNSNTNNNHQPDQQDDDDDDDDTDDDESTDSEPPTPTIDILTTAVTAANSLNNEGGEEEEEEDDDDDNDIDGHIFTTRQRYDFCSILLHAADISNTLRPWFICKQWSDLIVEEFFKQGDAERRNGLPISPGMDRHASDQASISLKFSDFIIKPYFEVLMSFIPQGQGFLSTLAENRLKWLQLKDQPFTDSSLSTAPIHPLDHQTTSSSSPLPLSSLTEIKPNRRVSVCSVGLITSPSSPPLMKKSHFIKRRYKKKYPYRITKSPTIGYLHNHYHHHQQQQQNNNNHLHKLRFSSRSASYPIIIPDLLLHHNSVNMDVGQISTLFQAQPSE